MEKPSLPLSPSRPTLGLLYGTRRNNLNFFRLFFAIVVIFSHSYVLTMGLQPGWRAEPLHRWTFTQIDFGALAVDAFFFISGFLLIGSLQNSPTILNFLGRRALRIYPGLIACIFFCVFIAGPLGGVDLHTYFKNPLTYRLFEYVFLRDFWNSLPGVFPHNPIPQIIDSSLWTIKYEVFCYLCLTLLGIVKLARPAAIFPLFLLAWALYNALLFRDMRPIFPLHFMSRLSDDFLLDPMPRLLTFFFAGSLFYLWRKRIPYSFPFFLTALALVLACYHHALFVPLPICGGYMLLYLAMGPRLHWSGFDHFDFSYGVYLYAWPVQQLVLHYRLVTSQSPFLLFLTALPAVFFLAAISWFAIEKPFLKLKSKRLHAQPPLS